MKEFLDETEILEHYIESLAENPAAVPPADLDKKSAFIVRGLNTLAQSHTVIVRDSLEEIQKRVWQKTIVSHQEQRQFLPDQTTFPSPIPTVKLKRSKFALTGLSLAACLALVILAGSLLFAVVPRTSTNQNSQDSNYVNSTPASASIGSAAAVQLPDSGLKPGRVTSFDAAVAALAYSPDGKYLAVATTDKLYLEDASGQTFKTLSLTTNVKKVVWSPDSQFLVILSRSLDARMSLVRRWNINEATDEPFIDAASPVVRDLAFSPDGQYLLTLSEDKGLRKWDKTGKLLLTRVSGNNLFAISPDGQNIMVSSLDGSLNYYKFEPFMAGKKLSEAFQFGTTFTIDKTPLTGLTWTADSQSLALCDKSGFTLMNKGGSFYKNGSLDNLTGTGCSFSPDGKFLVVSSFDGKLYPGLLKGNDFQGLAPLSRHSGSITALAWSPDGKTLVTGSADHSIVEWSVPVSAK